MIDPDPLQGRGGPEIPKIKNKFQKFDTILKYLRWKSPEIFSYFYIEKWTFKGMCEVYYRAKRDNKEATCL